MGANIPETLLGIVKHRSFFLGLDELPEKLMRMRDMAREIFEEFGVERVELSAADADEDTVEGMIVAGLRKTMGSVGLEYDTDMVYWRASLEEKIGGANQEIVQAKAWLDRTRARDMPSDLRKRVDALERYVRMLEEQIRRYDPPEPYLETILELRDEVLNRKMSGR